MERERERENVLNRFYGGSGTNCPTLILHNAFAWDSLSPIPLMVDIYNELQGLLALQIAEHCH